MIKEENILKPTIIRHKHCDDCGCEINNKMYCSVAKCEICEKDLCEKCVTHEDDNTGDYRTVYCERCWTIGEKYRNKISELENDIDVLYQDWHDECSK